MRSTAGFALTSPGSPRLVPWSFDRRDPRADDVVVRVDYCGVCGSDLHAIEAAGGATTPLVPGHEFTGTVIETGAAVTDFRAGEKVAVGNIVDSCGDCRNCHDQEEPYCMAGATLTYGGTDRVDGTPTLGAYSQEYVVRESFVYHLPPNLDPAGAAPLMCAGITVWQPLSRYRVTTGSRVGVVGMGGLGHLAVKFAHALGAHVTLFTTSPAKKAAGYRLGADRVIDSTDDAAMRSAAYSLDLILDTASGAHDLTPYVHTLDMDGTLCELGIPSTYEVGALALLGGRRRLTSSGSGGTRDTRTMLAFASEHGIAADVEVLPATAVNTALARLAAGDVAGRLVLDLAE